MMMMMPGLLCAVSAVRCILIGGAKRDKTRPNLVETTRS
eukprot:COSAG06_NODE_67725_length_251_cov_0.677632_1_plen_38_part_10